MTQKSMCAFTLHIAMAEWIPSASDAAYANTPSGDVEGRSSDDNENKETMSRGLQR